jgi:hypothetical protein
VSVDFQDWIDAIVVGAVSSDSADWARQITVVTGPLPGDLPDWVEATSVAGTGPASAISFVSAAGAATALATTAVVVPAPAGIVPGNLLTAFFGNNLASAATVTPPAGWTQAYTLWPGGGFEGNTFVFTKTATGSEPGSYTFTSTSAFLACAVVQWARTAALDGTPSSTSTTVSTTNTYPSLTPTVTGDMLVGWASSICTATMLWQPPNQATFGFDVFSPSDMGIMVWYQPLTSTAPTGTLTGLQPLSSFHIDSTLLLHA